MKSLIDKLAENECIYYGKDILLASGKTSNIYYDIKKAAGIPGFLNYITNELSKIIPENASIVAVSTGGIPYATALALRYNSEFAYVRQEQKKYGMQNLVEGFINFEKDIYIIDDVCTTGKSILKAKSSILKINNTAKCNLVSVVNRKDNNLNIKSLIEL